MILPSFNLQTIDYDNLDHLNYLLYLSKSKDMKFLGDLSKYTAMSEGNSRSFIVLNENNQRLGYFCYSEPIDGIKGTTTSLYYGIDEKFRGQGYSTKLANEMAEYLFDNEEIDAVIIQIEKGNHYSLQAINKSKYENIYEDDEGFTFISEKAKRKEL